MRDTFTQFGLNLKLTKKDGGTRTHVKSTSVRLRILVVTAVSPQMEDDVEVELELEKQVKLLRIFLVSF